MTERNTEMSAGTAINAPIAASTKIEAGKLVCANVSGYAVEGSTAANLTALGRAEETVDNSAGANGEKNVLVQRGAFHFKNSATNAVTQASMGKIVYIEDDETVAKDDGAVEQTPATKSAAGKCLGIDSDGVWVEVR